MIRRPKVVVIGAGAAGLACARSLLEGSGGGVEVVVLEARWRPGGRIHTVTIPGIKDTGDSDESDGRDLVCDEDLVAVEVDLGASFIHGASTVDAPSSFILGASVD